MRLIFLGAPGAGKGTQGELAEERLHIVHLASGDLLRQAARGADAVGRKITGIMEEGSLVPDELVTHLMLQHVEAQGAQGSFILDGFPRTVEQARALDSGLGKNGSSPIDLVVDFEVSADLVLSRLSGRRVCAQCGANYHLQRLRPRQEGQCDRCSGPLSVRRDDEPEVIRRRLRVYEEQTKPLLDFYRADGKLRALSGEGQVEEQYEQLIKLLRTEHMVAS